MKFTKLVTKQLIVALGVTAISGASANAAAIIYESFSQTAGAANTFNGTAASTTGLTGNWSDDQTVSLVNPSTLSYGDLANTGGQLAVANGNGNDVWVTTSSALGDAGLLNDGATLWFSYVYKKSAHGGSNEHSGFAFTTSRFTTGSSGPALDAVGYGFGAYTQGTNMAAMSFSNSTTRATSGSVALEDSTPIASPTNNDGFGETLIIGRMQWNADSGLNDTLTLWTRALDDIATAPSAGGATQSALILQGQLDTITFAQRNSGGTQTYDEIRFGASFADVSPIAIPEPSAALLVAIGSLLLLRRRR